MTARGWRAPPELARRIEARAQAGIACRECDAPPGQPCTQPGAGKTVHRIRWVTAAKIVKAEARAARRTPEQLAALAALPRIPREEIEACRLPGGGYSFTREWFLAHGLPFPPVAGWRRAVERGTVTTRPEQGTAR